MDLWKEILKEASKVKDNWKFRVGNGTRVRFWTDFWCGPSTLCHSFPSLFEIVVDKFTIVAEAWNHLDGRDGWNLNCVGAFNDWETDSVTNLCHVLQKERVSTAPDRVIWKGVADATFTVRNAYNLLVSRSISRFPVKNIWMASVPSKVSFFTWEAAWGEVLTLNKLQRRGWHLPNRCFLCGCAEETIHHILLHCLVVRPQWDIILSLVGVS